MSTAPGWLSGDRANCGTVDGWRAGAIGDQAETVRSEARRGPSARVLQRPQRWRFSRSTGRRQNEP